MTSRLRPRLTALFFLVAVGLAEAAQPLPPVDWLLEQVRLLSAPEMEGRASGSAGAERAARHIADVFKQTGLAPGGDNGSFFQSFEVGTRLGPGRARLLPREFAQLAGSSDGSGISAPELRPDERRTAQNVVGILRGTDPKLGDEAIVVGAHYDHLGRGSASSPTGQIYPGADDNASGTAGLMALARALVAAGGLPRTIIFAAFAGEEMGLLGSTHYVGKPPVPLERTVLMLNMDMIGRLRDGRLHVYGVESGAELRTLVTESARGLPLDLRLRGDPNGPSDHSPFYSRGLPVLLLTTGAHADYHKPTDSWEKIDPQGMEVVLTFVSRLLTTLGASSPPPAHVKPQPLSRRGAGAFLGVTLDYPEKDRPGVKLVGVAPGSPADRAGVKPGDFIVEFAGVSVAAPDDLIVAVRARRPGETVELVLLRDGAEHRLAATLGERR